MQKLKEYKYIILIALLVLGVAFYWYSWRPSKIRIQCNSEVANEVKGIENGRDAITVYNVKYQTCLRERGLEK